MVDGVCPSSEATVHRLPSTVTIKFMNSFKVIAQLEEAFDKNYNQQELNSGPTSYIKGFVKANSATLRDLGANETDVTYALANTLPKYKAIKFCSIPFINKAIFKLFRDWMSDEVRVVFDALVWTDVMDKDSIKQELDIDICDEELNENHYTGRKQKAFKIKKEFSLFKNKGNDGSFRHFQTPGAFYYYSNFKFSLPKQLRAVVCQYYEPPEGSQLKGLKEVKSTHQYINGERDIFLELARIIAYAKQGQIKTTTKGKPQASTLGKMQRKLNLQEFYPNAKAKDLKIIRTSLLAALIAILPNLKSEIEHPRLIKMLFLDYYSKKFSSLHGVITYLKGTGYLDEYYTSSVEPIFLKILSDLPANEWISFENLETFIKYQFYDFRIISPWTAKDKLYYNYDDEVKSEYSDYTYIESKHSIDESRYHKSLTLPLLKGTLMLFAAWGLLDIAYDDVDAEIMGKTCQSPYDGLKYVRLNNLGAYVTGKQPTYEVSEAVGDVGIKLSEDSLTIITPENDPTAAIILEPYAERVSPNRYRTDYTFFLKDCKSKRDLESKIKLFKQTVSADLPKNWVAFFRELEGKINPLDKVANVHIFKIPADNQTLIRLIARDKTLKNLCIKAEGYHVLVEKSKMSRFKKRLGEFGYLLG